MLPSGGDPVLYHQALFNYGLFAVQRAPAWSQEAFYEWWKEKLEAVHERDSSGVYIQKRDVLDVLGKFIQRLGEKRGRQG